MQELVLTLLILENGLWGYKIEFETGKIDSVLTLLILENGLWEN